jgi:hypothetical protein
MTQRQKPKPSDRPSPSPRMTARIAEAKLRNAARPERPALEYKLKDATTLHTVVTKDVAETLLDAFGTTSKDFLTSELNRLSNSQLAAGQLHAGQRELNAALAAIDGTRPENEMAAMLASQMAATHSLAMEMLGRTRRAETTELMQARGALATKLLRTFTAQTEALAKVKRAGEQTVRVEHVHVYPGGQAIVGAVSNRHTEGGGGVDEKGNQAYGTDDARAFAAAPRAALLGPNEIRDALPEAGGERQKALPAPRWGGR